MQLTFSNVWNFNHGFTDEEVQKKAQRVNQEYGVGKPGCIWKEATWVLDPHRKTGYIVVLESI